MKRIRILAGLMLLWCSAALAEVTGISVMGVYQDTNRPELHFAMRALDGGGSIAAIDHGNFRFTESASQIELEVHAGAPEQIGHIVVVDTSRYYYGTQKVTSENIRQILSGYLSRVAQEERVAFVLASAQREPVVTNYMSKNEAMEYARGIELGDQSEARINNAVFKAFQIAASPAAQGPLFHSVFIVCDPDLESNKDIEHSLSECAQLRAGSGVLFDVMLAIPYRDQFLKTTRDERRTALNQNMQLLRGFAEQVNGAYLELAQNDSGINTEALHSELTKNENSVYYCTVDYSALAGHVALDASTIQLNIAYEGVALVKQVPISVQLLPQVQYTPAPTRTPAPTPVVFVDDTDTEAMEAILALKELNYLDDQNYEEFNNICYQAYLTLCRVNGMKTPTNREAGIYEEGYKRLIARDVTPAPQVTPVPTPTPQPTATPKPTVPPEGYAVNDMDEDGSGEFIAQIQSILKRLNCYEEGVSSHAGRMDQATIDAINRYCKEFGWENKRADGVSKQICDEILKNGVNMSPIVTPEPTTQEKIRAFLNREVVIAGVQVTMMVPVLVCMGLFFAIAALIILMGGRKERRKAPEAETPPAKSEPKPQEAPKKPDAHTDETTVGYGQQGDQPYTMEADFGLPVKFFVSYNGVERVVEGELRSSASRYTIGRKGCDLLLDSTDQSASRNHAELFIANNSVCVHDNGSRNGTSVNGRKIRENGENGFPINNGDVLRIGNHMIRVKW